MQASKSASEFILRTPFPLACHLPQRVIHINDRLDG